MSTTEDFTNWNMKPKHAWYSYKADAEYGSVTYKNVHGENVVATVVAEDKEYDYGWDDKIYLGVVYGFVCSTKPSMRQFNMETR